MIGLISPDQLDEWWMYWMLEPWDVRTNAGGISQQVHVAAQRQMCSRSEEEWKSEYAGELADFILGKRDLK